MKTPKIVYWSSTAILCFILLYTSGNYFFNHDASIDFFVALGYPVYIIYPLGAAKIMGVTVILFFNHLRLLKEWVYAAFFFNFVLAFFAHFLISDGSHFGAFFALILLLTSYFTGKKVRP
ncbi:MAG: hypothetical protein CO119_06365 [Flavobacteriales bacterium CG_4_9_14_3_um_filter_40_17]|nr:MAG: hypothetical protein CO119_06365 [Flavobacteriales bacterium CG_4_9_14_3_um_filter_40_17]